jgi:hypothetical protein
MIHPYDTHEWQALCGQWITAKDHCSVEPIFQQATKIRIVPLYLEAVQAILQAEVPDGYTAFLRTDIHRDMACSEKVAKLGYILALERGEWPDPGSIPLDSIPLVDGFRAELCCWDGNVLFESSPDFYHKSVSQNGLDLYKFIKR